MCPRLFLTLPKLLIWQGGREHPSLSCPSQMLPGPCPSCPPNANCSSPPDPSLPPPARLRTPAMPSHAFPGINQRAQEAFDLWRVPASSSEQQHEPGAGTEQGASAGQGSEGMLLCQAPPPHLPPLSTPGPDPDPTVIPSLPFSLLPQRKNRAGGSYRGAGVRGREKQHKGK